MNQTLSSRENAIAKALDQLSDGSFEATMRRRVAIQSASRLKERKADLERYLNEEMQPHFERMGFTTTLLLDDAAPGPFLLAQRIENPDFLTILQYGHGDVVAGLDGQWAQGLTPFEMTERDGNWYGRGTADNKGQHSINMAAIEAVLAARGSLGFNLKYLIEMGEESGSPGLDTVCERNRDLLKADVLIASDGPRLALNQPTIFLGARGGLSFHMEVNAREDFQHSGNWGGLLANPGIELCHAITELVSRTGQIKVPEMTPGHIPENVRAALTRCHIAPTAGDPSIEEWWGEPGLTSEEKVFAWSSFEVMEMECGNLAQPLYAIPPKARARMQLRFPVNVDYAAVVPAVRHVLKEAGYDRVIVTDPSDAIFPASRLDPDHPWVRRVAASIEKTVGTPPAILPNLGGSLPNNIFSDQLGLPTVWIPHSYPGCLQHAANEHLPVSIVREGLAIMAGLYHDLGQPNP
ncbi:peptidase M20 family protein [Agrobacterium rubi TR3 = NBRC 13261]|uniref:Peptidase M20 family protein n=1 Tax=Agrobacterium rubi TR3 = NBRC 13261 TaxID=1368415 RepID=A0A081CSD7_9HYPH|nr:M20 family metallopeptidase [Agrobacterium rubi]MBP1878904.1 acetylornithine deacetylase/succinyl-diaminopimelate desuccinylase-like protein [Agrobacterium rubi]GAK69583.1 peptidase M20 family protein [Agrobacterium rubi TR3 = NBRC 13261]